MALTVVAATPQEAVPELESNGYYIEPGSSVTESVVSDAVFDGRAEGGRLYIVVLADEPPGGATTFADSVLDDLGQGYVLTVAPETVGYAGDGGLWTFDQMDRAVDASLEGSSDDEVIRLFIGELAPGAGPTPTDPGTGSGGSGWVWLLVLVGGGLLVFWLISRRGAGGPDLTRVKDLAREKLNQVANDIIELEDEVLLSEDTRVKEHYQRASQTYSTAMASVEGATTAQDLVTVSASLDEAIWELDAAEALLDGKPVPPKPDPPKAPTPAETAHPQQTASPGYERRPQRQSSFGSSELMNVLMAILASQGMRGGGGWGGYSGGGSTPGWPGGASRTGGGGMRRPSGGFGRMRGGGRRRGG